MSRPTPPRLARLLLEMALPADLRDDVVGDLEEVFHRRCRQSGTASATAWYVRESLAFAVRFSAQRWREGRASILDYTRRDLVMAFRRMRHGPGFAAIVVLSLALGIGANAAVYQVIEALSLRSLPVAEPERLVVLEVADMTRWEGRRTSGYPVLSNRLWERIRDDRGPFEGTFAWANASFTVEWSDTPTAVRGLYVSGDYFAVLGVDAMLGRTFRAADDRPGCAVEGVVISHGFWQRAFGGDPLVAGRTMVLDSHSVTVLGVTPPTFTGLEVGRAYDVAVPICSQRQLGGDEQWLDDGMVWWLTVLGRVPREATMQALDAELESRSPALFETTLPDDYPADRISSYLGLRLRAVPGGTGLSGLRSRFGSALLALQGVMGLVLLMVCTNLASLFGARGSARQREFAVRRALGASRASLLRELGIESVVLGTAGALGALALAGLMGGRLVDVLGRDISLDVSTGAMTATWVVGAAGLASLAFGLGPAWRASEGRDGRRMDALREGRGTSVASRGAGLRRALVVAQVALSFVLLFVALLFTTTLRSLLAVDTGFEPEGVAVARVDFRALALTEESRAEFKRDLLERIAGVPGIVSAAEVRHVPLGGTGSSGTVRRNGEAPATGTSVRLNAVTSAYLETMGVSLLAGRGFDRGAAPAASVAIATPALAERLGLGANPVGQLVRIDGFDLPLEVIGLVPDAKYFDLREEPVPTLFVPKDLLPDARAYTDFLIRTSVAQDVLIDVIREAVSTAGPSLSIQVDLLADTIRDRLVRERLMSMLSGFIGILAALVAAIGLYGVMSHYVSQRRSEIGVRIALGARGGDVLAMVFLQAGTLLLAGLALGVALGFAAAIAVRSLLFGFDAHAVFPYAVTAALLGAVAAIACYLPARRAARIEPRQALASE